jgi:hypothetical protein
LTLGGKVNSCYPLLDICCKTFTYKQGNQKQKEKTQRNRERKLA